MKFIVENEGLLGLFKGIGPQISKGLLVQGLLMMTKERYAPKPLALCSRADANLGQDGIALHRSLPLPEKDQGTAISKSR
jgi:hypothetical protein